MGIFLWWGSQKSAKTVQNTLNSFFQWLFLTSSDFRINGTKLLSEKRKKLCRITLIWERSFYLFKVLKSFDMFFLLKLMSFWYSSRVDPRRGEKGLLLLEEIQYCRGENNTVKKKNIARSVETGRDRNIYCSDHCMALLWILGSALFAC